MEEGECGIALLEDAHAEQGAGVFGKSEVFAVLDDDGGAGGEEGGATEKIENAGVFGGGGVRGIEEDVVDWLGSGFVF